MNTCEKYWWVYEHPELNKMGWEPVIEMVPQMVNPIDNVICDNNSFNTKMQLWIEVMHMCPETTTTDRCHNWELDCGGDSYDEAIDSLYNLIKEKYGPYES